MTGEQIEKGLKLAVSDLSDCAKEQIFDYINRLKDEIVGLTGKAEALEADRDNLLRTFEEVEERVRKATAKEICEKINKWRAKLKDEKELYAFYMGLGVVLDEISDKYGVEVEE